MRIRQVENTYETMIKTPFIGYILLTVQDLVKL